MCVGEADGVRMAIGRTSGRPYSSKSWYSLQYYTLAYGPMPALRHVQLYARQIAVMMSAAERY
eukprot:2358045-Rhodomonas_salina.1